MCGLNTGGFYVEGIHEGEGAERAESKNAGNLSKSFPVCIGARVMLTRNIWDSVGLFNGAQGTVYDIDWAVGTVPLKDPPLVIMVAFDEYDGPPFMKDDGSELRNEKGKLVVPILKVRQDFTLNNKTCSRTQFPLVISYAITVHRAQGVTLRKVVCDISKREFTTGLSYVAVSRASKLEGLMFDAPFERDRVYRDPPTKAMQAKLDDYERRMATRLRQPLYTPTFDQVDEDEEAIAKWIRR